LVLTTERVTTNNCQTPKRCKRVACYLSVLVLPKALMRKVQTRGTS
jgi:hypothetical protein